MIEIGDALREQLELAESGRAPPVSARTPAARTAAGPVEERP